MSAPSDEGGAPLQFEQAELDGPAPAGVTCAGCGSSLSDTYYAARGQTLCERCQAILRHDHEHGRGSSAGRFARACAFGLVAAVAGTLLWYAVRRFTGYEVGLIAVVVGYAVGGAVRAGSRGRGGWRYQALALLLTYGSIVTNYIPDIVSEIAKHQGDAPQAQGPGAAAAGAPAAMPAAPQAREPDGEVSLLSVGIALVLLFALAFAAPFLAGVQNIVGLFIIAIALYEAWKLNRRTPLEIGGPYRVGAAPPRVPAPVPAPITPE